MIWFHSIFLVQHCWVPRRCADYLPSDGFDRTELFAADVLVVEVPLRTTLTLATRLGAIPELIMVLGTRRGTCRARQASATTLMIAPLPAALAGIDPGQPRRRQDIRIPAARNAVLARAGANAALVPASPERSARLRRLCSGRCEDSSSNLSAMQSRAMPRP